MREQQLKEIYGLYQSGDYEQASILNNAILKESPDDMYAKKYAGLLVWKVKKEAKSEIPKIRWKQLKCSHCVSKISYTGLTSEQQSLIASGEYSNLEIKCPYCHTNFVLQKQQALSILGLKIGEKISYGGKNFRITWYVQYSWKWIEWRYSGKMWYLEWILLWDDNSYTYFSEWYSYDDRNKTNEFEFSEKYIPQWNVSRDSYTEKNELTVASVYGENSKSYTIWEQVVLLDFGSYVLETEWAGSQKEVWFYKNNKISYSEALKVFNKQSLKKENSSQCSIISKIIIFAVIIGPILTFVVFKPLFGLFQNKTEISINQLTNGKQFQLDYLSGENKTTGTTKYDYGGVKTHYEQKTGIQFSLETPEDIKLLETIMEQWPTVGWDLKEMAEWKIYIIK